MLLRCQHATSLSHPIHMLSTDLHPLACQKTALHGYSPLAAANRNIWQVSTAKHDRRTLPLQSCRPTCGRRPTPTPDVPAAQQPRQIWAVTSATGLCCMNLNLWCQLWQVVKFFAAIHGVQLQHAPPGGPRCPYRRRATWSGAPPKILTYVRHTVPHVQASGSSCCVTHVHTCSAECSQLPGRQ